MATHANVTHKVSDIEFDVDLTCQSCSNAVEECLSKLNGVESFKISVPDKSVVVKTSLPSQVVQEALNQSGRKAVLKGFGSSTGQNTSLAAVAEITGKDGVVGVVRFHQVSDNACIIDGTVDGLREGEHGLHIHEFGDLSGGCDSIGYHFNPMSTRHGGPLDDERHYGDLGNIHADSSGRANFRLEDSIVKVYDIIGRSLAVTSGKDDLGCGENESSKLDGNSGDILACAIIARSAGLFQNPKRLCQCDGISIWDETTQLAGKL